MGHGVPGWDQSQHPRQGVEQPRGAARVKSRSGSRSGLVGPGTRQRHGWDATGAVAQAGPSLSLKVAARGRGASPG